MSDIQTIDPGPDSKPTGGRTEVLPNDHPHAGKEVHYQTWNEVAESMKSRLEAQAASAFGKEAQTAHDILVLLHIIMGNGDEEAPHHVVLTKTGEQKVRIEDLRRQLAEEEAKAA